MTWWKRSGKSGARIAEARKSLSATVNTYKEAQELRVEADRNAEEFKERAITLREIRLKNNITSSIFPPHERTN